MLCIFFWSGSSLSSFSFEHGHISSVLLILLLLPSCACGTSSSPGAVLAEPNRFQPVHPRCFCPWLPLPAAGKPSCLDEKPGVSSCWTREISSCWCRISHCRVALWDAVNRCRTKIRRHFLSFALFSSVLLEVYFTYPFLLSSADRLVYLGCKIKGCGLFFGLYTNSLTNKGVIIFIYQAELIPDHALVTLD